MFFLLLFSQQLHAQNGQSPYTTIGIGEIQGMSLIHNDGMGGVGIATAKPWNMSTINPAWLPMNNLTTLEVGFTGEQRNLRQDTLRQTVGGGNLRYLAFSFPLKAGRVTTSIGLMPYSRVDYHIKSSVPVRNGVENVNTVNIGSGGINQAFIATGIRFFDDLYVGARFGYLFSSINEELTVNQFSYAVNDTTYASIFKTTYTNQTSFSDIYLSLGAAYELKLNEKTYINLGATYDLETSINAERYSTLERRRDREVNGGLVDETLEFTVTESGLGGNIILPPRYGVGIALQRGTRWNIAADAVFQDWSQFRDFNGSSQNMAQMSRYAVGIEFIPDFFSVRRYLDRVTYKLGFNYENTPFVKNNQQISEIGINFGTSLPVGPSIISMAFGYGQRGTTENNLVFEDYFRFSLGVSFNDRWFQQRKYD